MSYVLIVDDEYRKYREHLEPRFPDVTFQYAEDGKAAIPFIPAAEIIISIGRWLTPEIVAAAKNQ